MASLAAATATARRAKARKRKADEDDAAPGGEDAPEHPLVPESHLFEHLCTLEREMDDVIKRRRIEMEELQQRARKVTRTLRVYVYSVHHSQKDTSAEYLLQDLTHEAPSSWTLRVEGRVLDADGAPQRRFTSFFRRLVVLLDPAPHASSGIVEWTRDASWRDTDGFEVKRVGDEPVTATVQLLVDHVPPRYTVDPALARALGLAQGTRGQVLQCLWDYAKNKQLLAIDQPDKIRCDDALRSAFGVAELRVSDLGSALSGLLLPPAPVEVVHVIGTAGEPAPATTVDIEVEVDDPAVRESAQALGQLKSGASGEASRSLQQLDVLMKEAVARLQERRQRREYFLKFAQNPHEFITDVLASQTADLAAMRALGSAEATRTARFYHQQWVGDAVDRYLAGQAGMR